MHGITEIESKRFDEKKLEALAEGLQGDSHRAAQEALNEILRLRQRELALQDELKKQRRYLKEAVSFFGNWAEGFERLIQNPVNLEDKELLQTRHHAIRESAKNLVASCRSKVQNIMLQNQ